MTSGRWRSATKCMLWRVFPKGRQGAAALTPSTLACRSATSLANPNPEPSAGCRGADVAPDRPAVHDRSGHEVANPLQPGPHRPVPLAGKRVWSTARQGSRSFRRAVGKVAGRRGDYAAAGRHEAFYVSSARIALSTIQPPQWKRRCVTGLGH